MQAWFAQHESSDKVPLAALRTKEVRVEFSGLGAGLPVEAGEDLDVKASGTNRFVSRNSRFLLHKECCHQPTLAKPICISHCREY
jgi:hypothetical protein